MQFSGVDVHSGGVYGMHDFEPGVEGQTCYDFGGSDFVGVGGGDASGHTSISPPSSAPMLSTIPTPSSEKRQSTKKRPSSDKHSMRNASPQSETSSDPADKIVKRQRNTEAARRYRQRKVDRVTELEEALAAMTRERDDFKLKLARSEAEVDVLRRLIGKGS